MITDTVRRFGSDREYRRLVRRVAVLDVIGCEGARLLVLANTVRVLGGIAKGAFVKIGRASATNVEHDEANGAADRGIGPVSGAESVGTAVHSNRAGDRTIDDHQR